MPNKGDVLQTSDNENKAYIKRHKSGLCRVVVFKRLPVIGPFVEGQIPSGQSSEVGEDVYMLDNLLLH